MFKKTTTLPIWAVLMFSWVGLYACKNQKDDESTKTKEKKETQKQHSTKKKFNDYKEKAELSDAQLNIKKILDAASLFFSKEHVSQTGSILPPHFPKTVGLTPAETCCKKQTGQCRETDWSHPTWRALHFSIPQPHRFRYQFFSCGTKNNAHGMARAVAQPNCDGEFLIIEGSIGVENGKAIISPKRKVYRSKSLPKDTCSK